MRRFLVLLTLAAVIFGCNKAGQSDTEVDKLSEARAKWETAGTSAYIFNAQRFCECLQVLTNRVQIAVANDSILSITSVADQSRLPDSLYAYFATVDDWFDWIATSLERDPYIGSVTYDPDLGYPRQINFDFNRQIADDELSATLDSLVLLVALY